METIHAPHQCDYICERMCLFPINNQNSIITASEPIIKCPKCPVPKTSASAPRQQRERKRQRAARADCSTERGQQVAGRANARLCTKRRAAGHETLGATAGDTWNNWKREGERKAALGTRYDTRGPERTGARTDAAVDAAAADKARGILRARYRADVRVLLGKLPRTRGRRVAMSSFQLIREFAEVSECGPLAAQLLGWVR